MNDQPTTFRTLLKSKIHRATLTGKELNYEGSIGIDRLLMDAADLVAGEQVHVLNLNNGSRLITYVIEAPTGSGTILLNGPAARLGEAGDLVVIISYAQVTESAVAAYRARIVQVDPANRLR